jgi:hypothetical protein
MGMSKMRVGVSVLAAVLVLSAGPVRADKSTPDFSLKWVPADACSYGAVLRNKEIREGILHSKAWSLLKAALPFAKDVLENSEKNLGNAWPDDLWWLGDLNWTGDKELQSFLQDLLADEVFYFGVGSWHRWLMALDELDPHELLPLHTKVLEKPGSEPSLLFSYGGSSPPQVEALVSFLAKTKDLKTPELLVGFKLRDPAAARKRLDRLLGRWKELARELPYLKGLPQKTRIAGHDFTTVSLQGGMLSWDNLPVPDKIRDSKDWKKLTAKLNKLKINVSAGIRDGYLLVGVGEDAAILENLGKKPLLMERPELKPLVQHSDRRFTSIFYASKETQLALDPGKKAIDKTFRWLPKLLKEAQLPADLTAKLNKDLKAAAKDLMEFVIEPGALLTYSFLTDRGLETVTHDWSKDPLAKETRPLTLMDHAGGTPLLFCAGRSTKSADKYRTAAKWLKSANKYLDELVVPNLDDKQKRTYRKAMSKARPLLARLDEVTTRMLLPALADEQTGFVIDGWLKSIRWHESLPPSAQPLPLLEPAILTGVSNASLLCDAFHEFRTVANKLLALQEESEFQIPSPATKKIKTGQLFHYPLPNALAWDRQLLPTAAVGKDLGVLAISKSHAERLLTQSPLKVKDGPLSGVRQPAIGVVYVNAAGLLSTIRPWVTWALQNSDLDKESVQQVEQVLKILGVFRSYSSVTYPENGALITHTEFAFRDVE